MNGQKAIVLIDSGASRNYLNSKFAVKHQIAVNPQAAIHPTIELADGTTSQCEEQAKDLTIELQTYQAKKQTFDVLLLSKYDIIFRKPWL